MQNKLKVASLFCGCGGSDLGMVGGFDYLGKRYEELPFEIAYAVDFDHWAVETYNKNFKHKAVCADVTEVDFSKISDIDVMIGGFPCQSFSTVNPTKDTNDARANLYKQIVRFLQTKHPKYFICENVKGLMTLQGGSIVNKIIGEFCQCGYRVEYRLLKAVEFGVPQRRERVIIIGVRNDLVFNYEYPTPICTEETATPLGAVIDKLDIEEQKYYFSKKAVEGMKNAKNNMKRGLWQDLSKPCLTITAHLAKTSINSRDPLLLVDPATELYRRFTPREAARIQSFPYIAKQLQKAIIAHGQLNEDEINSYMQSHSAGSFCPVEEKKPAPKYKQLNFLELFDIYEDGEIVNNVVREDHCLEYGKMTPKQKTLNREKNVLISLVKKDNVEQYLDNTAKIYYTGKKFPATVALNKLYYFMPYIKGKGIKDLYFIKIARVGTRKEGQPDEDPKQE